MIRVSTFTIIDRPADVVFAHLANVRLYPLWQIGVTKVSLLSPEPFGLGSRFEVHRVITDRALTGVREVVEFDPERGFAHRSVEGDTNAELRLTLEPMDQRTKVTLQLQTDADRVMGMAGPLASRLVRREQEAALGNLKDLLVRSGSSPNR